VAKQNPVWNNMIVHPTWKKKIIVQRRSGFSQLLFPHSLARRDRNFVNLGLES